MTEQISDLAKEIAEVEGFWLGQIEEAVPKPDPAPGFNWPRLIILLVSAPVLPLLAILLRGSYGDYIAFLASIAGAIGYGRSAVKLRIVETWGPWVLITVACVFIWALEFLAGSSWLFAALSLGVRGLETFIAVFSALIPFRLDPVTVKPGLPYSDAPLTLLKHKAAEITELQALFPELTVFDPQVPEHVALWNGRKFETIEQAVGAGSKQTLENWDLAGEVFNLATAYVDIGRAKLRYALKSADEALLPYAITYPAIDTEHSKTLYVFARAPIKPKRANLRPSYNYSGMMVSRAITGSMPWQAAGAAVAITAVAYFVNETKRIRQLKTWEGEVGRQAEEAKGDISLIGTLLATRLAPQIEAIIDVCQRMESSINDAQGSFDQSVGRNHAFEAARAVVEGRQLLARLAGD